jgi:uncharacterized protein involved in type VI secretion and phage assembly
VLVVLSGDEPVDAYIIGGLWNTQDSPPVSNPINPIETTTKRVIKTGLKAGSGHVVEFDDGPGQSITITTSTQQKITINPSEIELSNTGGTLKLTLDNKRQTVSIDAPIIEITAKGILKLNGKNIQIGSSETLATVIKGMQVFIN